MRANWLGLLGLLSILVLILIYILKPKYDEKKVSSTYIWKLSLKYTKKKVPLEWLTASILIFLQIAILVIAALLMANAEFKLKSKAGEKIAVLDCSASMMATENPDGTGDTRFARAVSEIIDLAEETIENGDLFSIILADETPGFMTVGAVNAERLGALETDLPQIQQALSQLTCGYGTADIPAAINQARSVMLMNRDSEIILFTGDRFDRTENVTVRTMGANSWNAGVLDFTVSNASNFKEFKATIGNYGFPSRNSPTASIGVQLQVEGKRQKADPDNPGQYTEEEGTFDFFVPINLGNQEEITVTWGASERIIAYTSAKVTLSVNDSFYYDDFMCLFGGTPTQFNVQVVTFTSESALDNAKLFWEGAFRFLTECRVDIIGISPKNIEEGSVTYGLEKYDLYVFDNFIPDTDALPQDGSVFFTGLPATAEATRLLGIGGTPTTVEASENDPYYPIPSEDSSGDPETAAIYSEIIASFESDLADAPMTKYTKINLPENTEYKELLSCSKAAVTDNPDPLMLVKTDIATNRKTLVYTSSIAFSKFAVSTVLPLLVMNVVDYSLKPMMPDYMYTVGETAVINGRIGTTLVEVLYNEVPTTSEEIELPIEDLTPKVWQSEIGRGVLSAGFNITVPGRHVVVQRNMNAEQDEDGQDKTLQFKDSFFARLERGESIFFNDNGFLEAYRPDSSDDKDLADKFLDFSCWVALAMLVIMIIEWWVQYREQF